MFFSADLANLLLYCAQQLGVMLGVGAETIMLAAYLISMRDGVMDEKETQYARAIKKVMSAALVLIVLSGIGITALHALAGESAIIFTPAFLFKWLLVMLILALTLLRKATMLSIVEGVIGATWYALFVVHILAPVTSWSNLGIFYAVWLAGFVICWETVVLLRRDKKRKAARGISVPLPAAKAPRPQSGISVPLPFVKKTEPLPTPTPAPATIIYSEVPHVSPVPSIPPAPAGKVTDTPFLPTVPPLQQLSAVSEILPAPAVPQSDIRKGTLMPSGGAVPLPPPPSPMMPTAPQETGLSAITVMPKKPADIAGGRVS